MNKEDYIRIANEKIINVDSRKVMVDQIFNYFNFKDDLVEINKFDVGDDVYLKKGTLLHGTYKNFEGLKYIVENGLISGWFIDGRLFKYPSSVGVWNLKQDYYLADYIDFYSGGTIMYSGVVLNDDTKINMSSVIKYSQLNNLIDIVKDVDCHMWYLEQTKETRFMPSLVQNNVQICIIFNGDNNIIDTLLSGDILSSKISDEVVKEFVNSNYYDTFIKERINKNDFFTDRESAILFGIPSNLIEGILVGRNYENDDNMLKEIKSLLPNCYICNLDGKVIVGNK